MGDDLKFIDFHQLQIENKKSIREIEQRNSQLMQYKLNATRVMQTLQSLKTQLHEASREEKFNADSMKEMEQKRIKNERTIADTQKDIQKLLADTRMRREEQQE